MNRHHQDPPEPRPSLHPADLADRLQRDDPDEARAVLKGLPPDMAAAVITELEDDRLPDLLAAFDAGRLAEILPEFTPTAGADLLQHLPIGLRREILSKLSAETAEAVRSLLKYPEDTAGGIMSNRFIALRETMTVEQVRELLRAHAQEERVEDVSYLYVVNEEDRLP